MYDPEPVPRELLLKIVTPDLLERWHSAGGVVAGGEKIASGQIENAFAFIGAGGLYLK